MNDPNPASGEVTRLLDAIRQGDDGATDRLLPVVYAELRGMARSHLAREHAPGVHQPTSLVHEAYLRLVGDREVEWESRAHFFGAAAEAMRRILVDRARERAAQKRGGDLKRVTLDESAAISEPPAEELLALDRALQRLEQLDGEMAQVTKLRYFAGMTVPEVAAVLGQSPRTVNRLWSAARAWLQREMRQG